MVPSQTTTRRCHLWQSTQISRVGTREDHQPPRHLVSVLVSFVVVRLGSGNVAAGLGEHEADAGNGA